MKLFKPSMFALAAVAALISSNAVAWDPVDDKTVRVNVSYMEPNQNTNNAPLTDLKDTLIYYSIGDGPNILGHTEPATTPNGGGIVSITMDIPVAAGTKATPAFYGVARDAGLNPSLNSAVVLVVVDRLGPNVVTDFIVE